MIIIYPPQESLNKKMKYLNENGESEAIKMLK